MFGARTSATSANISTIFNPVSSIAGYVQDFGDHNQTRGVQSITPITSKVEIYNSKNKRYVNNLDTGTQGTIITTAYSGTFTTVNNLLILAKSNGYLSDHTNFSGKMYSCKIWDNNTLVRHFIPVKKKSTGEVMMIDILTGQEYTNQGTGTFIGGNPVNTIKPVLCYDANKKLKLIYN